MNSEERKEYNKNYYTQHKKELLEQLAKPIECLYCKRQVASSRLKSHQKTPLCLRNRTQYICITEVEKEVEKRVQQILNHQEPAQIITQPQPINTIEISPLCHECLCGSSYIINNNGKYYHEKTKKHIKWVENKNKNIE